METVEPVRSSPIHQRRHESMRVETYQDSASLGVASAFDVAAALIKVLAHQPLARMVLAAAPSQSATLACLARTMGIDWQRVVLFHMDEFIGLPAVAPQRFAAWLQRNFFAQLDNPQIHRIVPEPDANLAARDYAGLLDEAPIDIVCLGIGVNGHIAFNDPPVANFNDPLDVKVVALDQTCRQQQLDDQGFADLSEVPREAITLTVPRLLRADSLFCMVPGAHKASAVRASLCGPISTQCPASVLRTHANCTLYLDNESDYHEHS